jgi:hypothetical protein
MQGKLSTHAIAFPAANSPLMSVIKLTVNPQLHAILRSYPAVNAFEQQGLEAAGIPSSLPLRFLQQKGKGPDQNITEAEFDHFLEYASRASGSGRTPPQVMFWSGPIHFPSSAWPSA